VEDSESEDDEVVSQGRNNQARGTIIVPPARSLRQIRAHLNVEVSFVVYGSGICSLLFLWSFFSSLFFYFYFYLYFPSYGLFFRFFMP
jgi:hypothetical protein